jgi:hypothetical protein
MYSNLLKKIVLISTVLTISGCVSVPNWFGEEDEPKLSPVEIRTVEVKTPIVHPEMPRAIKLKVPQWYVVSDKNLEEFLERIAKRHQGQVVFTAMSIGDYELMAYNMQEIKRYINQLKEVVIYYRTLNEEPKDAQTNTGESEESRSGSHQQTQDER